MTSACWVPILGSEGDILTHPEPELGLVTDQAAESLQMQILGTHFCRVSRSGVGSRACHFKRSADLIR